MNPNDGLQNHRPIEVRGGGGGAALNAGRTQREIM
jgi:hypothetical protein